MTDRTRLAKRLVSPSLSPMSTCACVVRVLVGVG